jgi:hypothetical protein
VFLLQEAGIGVKSLHGIAKKLRTILRPGHKEKGKTNMPNRRDMSPHQFMSERNFKTAACINSEKPIVTKKVLIHKRIKIIMKKSLTRIWL